MRYELEDVPLDETLATCEALTAPQRRARGLAFHAAGGDPALTVRADRETLQQVVLDLLANAIEFTAPDGTVALAARVEGGRVHVTVQDSGCGIPADQRERVFEPFVQVDTSRTRTHDGVGLRLAIGRDLARGMGGDLTVER